MDNKSYQKYFSKDKLTLAWYRMITSNGRDIKDYFGIELFQNNLDENLSGLSELLLTGNYKPQRPFKYYEPKASRTQRTKSVLYVEDALVYQAIANEIATTNYTKLAQHNDFVYGSVLHSNVEKGIELLEEEDPDYYFFEYYIPLYNKFINSVNEELDNSDIKYKLETDITGFFDCIPHSKLLITLHEFGVESDILELLATMLNIFSGTRESLTQGVGIPQGPASSFFFANVLLHSLDHELSLRGFTYYRYMDDIRIYEEDENELTHALVFIDQYLKGKALSLNTKKTSIEEIGDDREAQKLKLLELYDFKNQYDTNSEDGIVSEMEISDEQNKKYVIKTISGDELIAYCEKEIKDTEGYLLKVFQGIGTDSFDKKNVLSNTNITDSIIHLAYRWRLSISILKQHKTVTLNEKLIDVWLFCTEHFFWKASHFCWNLNQFGANKHIHNRLKQISEELHVYEWVRYQILSNPSFFSGASAKELKDLFRQLQIEDSPLVRLGIYVTLLKSIKPKSQLLTSVQNALSHEQNTYVKRASTKFLLGQLSVDDSTDIKYWFGL